MLLLGQGTDGKPKAVGVTDDNELKVAVDPAIVIGTIEVSDGTTGPVAVKAATDAPDATDKALVVGLSPNGNQATAAQLTALLAAVEALTLATRSPESSVEITPDDDTDLTGDVTKGVKVATGGNLVYRLVDDAANRTIVVADKEYVPGNFKRVMEATTAEGLVGFGD